MASGAPHEIEGLIFLLSGIVLISAGAIIEVLERPAREKKKDLRAGRLMLCGACRGEILKEATRCRHCGTKVEHPTSTSS
jgi:hypothetical protein